ncbi:MAG TPA: molybdenum cofactor guanylyltransferase [Anaerolineales bacterium]
MISLAIQSGGQSHRMGEDKALKLFLGRPLIQRVVERLTPIADEVLLTTNHPERYGFLGIRLVPDLIPGLGPLGGLYTALASASYPTVAVVACDMPFASAALLEQAAKTLVEQDADIVIPRTVKGLEPLHAIYRRSTCLPVVLSAIKRGQLKVIDWFPLVRVREQPPEEVIKVDPSGLTFWNINTPEEFNEAENLCRDRQ